MTGLNISGGFTACSLALVVPLLIGLPAHAGGTTIVYVDDDAPPGGDGTTWRTAFRFLASALNSIDPDQDADQDAGRNAGAASFEVRVAQGTYKPDRTNQSPDGDGNRAATFELHANVTLRGGFAGLGAADPDLQDPAAFLTILDGDLMGDDAFGLLDDNTMHVVTIGGLGTLLDGVMIRGGVGGSIEVLNSLIGGGILSIGWPLTVTRCALLENRAELGAAIYHWPASLPAHQCKLTDCLIADNSGGFGAIRLRASTGTFTNCVLRDNVVEAGGAVAAVSTSGQRTLTLHDCVFEDNRSSWNSGAVSTTGNVRLVVSDTRFAGNSGFDAGAATTGVGPSRFTRCAVLDNAGGFLGAGGLNLADEVFTTGDRMLVSNTVFAGNSTPGSGGGARASTWVKWTNCIFVQNSAFAGGGAIWSSAKSEIGCCTIAECGTKSLIFTGSGDDTIVNSIVVSDFPPVIEDMAGLVSIGPSMVSGGWSGAGTGVIDGDPLFVAPDARDVRLAQGSPAIDAGDAALLPFDEADLDGNGQLNTLSVDFFSAPRIQGAAPDLGAIEGAFKAMAVMASVDGLVSGASAELVPQDDHPWAGRPVRVTITNTSSQPGSAAVSQIGWTRHRDAGGFSEESVIASLVTTLPDGGHLSRVVIPFSFAESPFDDPSKLRLVAFDPQTNAWRLAVALAIGDGTPEGAPSGAFSYVVGDSTSPPPLSDGLGDHGVFFDALRSRGFAWANVDIARDFGVGRNLVPADIAPLGGDGVVDGSDLGAVLSAWGSDSSASGADINDDGLVDGADLAAVLAAWTGSGG